MSLHQTNKDKPRAQKCRHFCFSFDLHNYCPTCREAGKGDDPCVTFETPSDICASFTDEQRKKIQHRKRYLKKQKAETSYKDNELDLLGEGDGDSFTGSNADLESAADNLFFQSTVQHSLLVLYLTSMNPRINTLLHLNYLRKRSRTHTKSKATLVVGRKLIPGLPRTNQMKNPMNLGSLLPDLKSTLIRVNTNQGPDMCHLLQGRISPL